MLLFVLILISLIFTQPALGASNPFLTEVNISDSQWVEIYNPDNTSINLSGWKIGNQSGSQTTISSLEIGATSFAVFTISPSIFKTDESNYVELWNGENSVSRAPSFPSNLGSSSWSRQSENNWCVIGSTKNSPNNSCPTPTPILTPTLTPTKTPSVIPTASVLATPTKEPTPTLEVAPTLEPTSIPDPSVQGTQVTSVETTPSSNPKPKKNNIGIIFIITGGLLLISPLLITQIQKWREKALRK